MKYLTSIFLAMVFFAVRPAAEGGVLPSSPFLFRSGIPDSSLPFLRSTGDIASIRLRYSSMLKGIAGFSRQGRPVEAYYFPGTSGKRAMVIGGVHGSELSSVSVARALLEMLQHGAKPFYSVLVIPSLFPDNLAAALARPEEIGSVSNIGRYSSSNAIDPNRQMPSLGKAFDHEQQADHLGRPVEGENALLLACIERFAPERIVNIHAIRNTAKAGIYADPRTDHQGYALGYETDSSLAVQMAGYICKGGGLVGGNRLDSFPTALYPYDPPVAARGQWQKRNLSGSSLPGGRGHGVSLGGWASTAVFDPLAEKGNRPAIRLITMEFPGNKRPDDYTDSLQQAACTRQVELYAASIRAVFLEKEF